MMIFSRSFMQDLRFVAFFAASVFFELPFIWNFLASSRSWTDQLAFKIVLLHVMAALVWLFFEPWSRKRFFAIERYWSRLFTFLVLCFPVFGLLIVLGIQATIPKAASDAADEMDEEDEDFMPAHSGTALPAPSMKERVLSELDFMPLADIMEGDDVELKRGAIERLTELKTPESVGLLLKHRSDASAEIRFYVTSSLVKIKSDFDEQLDAAKKQMQRDITKVSARVFLARIYWHYAVFGILDPMTSANHVREAVYHLKYAVESSFDSVESYKLLGEIYFKSERFDEFRSLARLMKEKKGFVDCELLGYLAEIEFKQKRFLPMKEALSEMRKEKPGKEWEAILAWWGVEA